MPSMFVFLLCKTEWTKYTFKKIILFSTVYYNFLGDKISWGAHYQRLQKNIIIFYVIKSYLSVNWFSTVALK